MGFQGVPFFHLLLYSQEMTRRTRVRMLFEDGAFSEGSSYVFMGNVKLTRLPEGDYYGILAQTRGVRQRTLYTRGYDATSEGYLLPRDEIWRLASTGDLPLQGLIDTYSSEFVWRIYAETFMHPWSQIYAKGCDFRRELEVPSPAWLICTGVPGDFKLGPRLIVTGGSVPFIGHEVEFTQFPSD